MVVSAAGKQIFQDMHPDKTFAFSNCWFAAFKQRFRISYRRPTDTCQKEPGDKESVILSFHLAIRDAARATENPTGPLGKYSLDRTANVDQTPLPFCFTDGPTYEDTGSSTVWVRSGASGLEKWQCTIQLTLFSDGEP